MRLLLLLSAFLSALVGAGGDRASAAPVQAVAMASVAASQASESVNAHRPVQPPVLSIAIGSAPLAKGWKLTPAIPVYLARMRI